MVLPTITQYQTSFNEVNLLNKARKPVFKYDWLTKTVISFDKRSILNNNAKSKIYSKSSMDSRPVVDSNTFYSQSFNYIGTEDVARQTSHKSKRVDSSHVTVSSIEKKSTQKNDSLAKNDASNYMSIFGCDESDYYKKSNYQQNNFTALAPKFNEFLVEPSKGEIKNMFSSNSDRSIFPDKYNFTEFVWRSANQSSLVDRNQSAHPKLEQALNGNRYVGLDQYQLYRPPKYGIRDPGFLINSFNKQIVPTVKVDSLRAASKVNLTDSRQYNHLTHYEP